MRNQFRLILAFVSIHKFIRQNTAGFSSRISSQKRQGSAQMYGQRCSMGYMKQNKVTENRRMETTLLIFYLPSNTFQMWNNVSAWPTALNHQHGGRHASGSYIIASVAFEWRKSGKKRERARLADGGRSPLGACQCLDGTHCTCWPLLCDSLLVSVLVTSCSFHTVGVHE